MAALLCCALSLTRGFVADNHGVTAIEYALIAAITIAAMAVAVPAIGLHLAAIFTNISAKL
ncbi:MAG: Flp family type IVb pilin [Steroidobacteraceae bacterium]